MDSFHLGVGYWLESPKVQSLALYLFLIFLNDIPHVVKHCQIRMFADDTSLFIEVDERVSAAERLEKRPNNY